MAGQAQVNGDVSASSVSGTADAASGADADYSAGPIGNNVSDASTISGLNTVDIDVASDASVLGTAIGSFTTTAESTDLAATAEADQDVYGIQDMDISVGGVGSIAAIAQDSNFVEASSVMGDASATATVDAIGLDGGDISISSDAVLTSSVSVDSAADSSTVGA